MKFEQAYLQLDVSFFKKTDITFLAKTRTFMTSTHIYVSYISIKRWIRRLLFNK